MRPSPMFGVVCVGNSNACASFITFAGFGTWATIPKCLYQMVEHSFTPNVVPGIARTEASPLLCVRLSQLPSCEGVNSRAHAKPNLRGASSGKIIRVNSRAHAKPNIKYRTVPTDKKCQLTRTHNNTNRMLILIWIFVTHV